MTGLLGISHVGGRCLVSDGVEGVLILSLYDSLWLGGLIPGLLFPA